LLEKGRGALVVLADVLARWIRAPRERWSIPGTVCYFPTFPSREDLTNHYYRACWYAPRIAGRCDQVFLFQSFERGQARPGPRPAHMGAPPPDTSHIMVRAGRLANLRTLVRCRVILIWRGGWWSRLLRVADRLGFGIVNVDTDDPRAIEYGNYCSLIWKQLLPAVEKHAVLAESRRRFREVAARVARRGARRACVLGTGPSLEEAYEFDFSDAVIIVCNSSVQDARLLNHVRPAFVVAADVVSHFGVSRYAHKFREDLVRVLRERDVVFVTVATFGYLFVLHHPEVADRVIFVNQTWKGANYDLLEDFRAARLDSIMNILMLPLAATFAREIHLLGCDGKSADRSNEDFWAHAAGAQYHDLVVTGHLCHPTFDGNRRRGTYERYRRSIEETIRTGERKHGIVYRCLRPSSIPIFRNRYLAAEGSDRDRSRGPRGGPAPAGRSPRGTLAEAAGACGNAPVEGPARRVDGAVPETSGKARETRGE